jgi:hypothetical protein
MNWLRSIWSEPDGTGSSTRVHMTALIAFVIGVGVSFGIATHQKKFSIEQFNNFLEAGSTFIVTTCGPLYGANKVSDYLKDKTAKQAATGNGSVTGA